KSAKIRFYRGLLKFDNDPSTGRRSKTIFFYTAKVVKKRFSKPANFLIFTKLKIYSMKIRFYGQNSLSIETGGKHIIVDPFISENPLSKDKIDIKDLKADYILLTHAHGDHVLDAEAIAKNTGAKIISNFEIVTYYEAKDIEGHGMNHGGSFEFDFGKLKMVNALHSSSFPDGTYGGNPAGYILESDGKTIYIAGD